MLEKSNPNQPKNNIVPFVRREIKNKTSQVVLWKWKMEKINDSESYLEKLNQLENNWSKDHDRILQRYLEENNNVVPNLAEFFSFLNKELRYEIFGKEEDVLQITEDCVVIIGDENSDISNYFSNLPVRKILEPLFGKIDEDLDFSQISILATWKEEYDTLNNQYVKNTDLKNHILNIKILLEKIELSYKDFSEKDSKLAKYLDRFLLEMQRESLFYTKELNNN